MKRPVVIGAAVLTAVVLAAFGYQRGGMGAGSSGNSIPCADPDAARSRRLGPCDPSGEYPLPAASNPEVKRRLDHENNLKDAARLVELATELQKLIETDGDLAVSVGSLKKADEAAKLAKKLHDRMKGGNGKALPPPRGMDASQSGH